MKVEVVIEAGGLPVGVATDAANVPETVVGPAARASIPAAVRVRFGVPVVADRADDSDPLREALADDGFTPVAGPAPPGVEPEGDGRRPAIAAVQAAVEGRADVRPAAQLPAGGDEVRVAGRSVRRVRGPGLCLDGPQPACEIGSSSYRL